MQGESYQESLKAFLNYHLSSLYTALPARIITVHASLNSQRVDVQPLPKRRLQSGAEAEMPPILNIPLMFPSSKKAAVTFPVDVGDTVLIVFSQRSLDGFKGGGKGTLYSTQDRRKFDVRDAIAIPGLFSFADAINDPSKHTFTHSTKDVVIVNNLGTQQENEFRLKDGGDITLNTNENVIMNFNDGTFNCNNFTVNAQNAITIKSATYSLNASSSISFKTATMSIQGTSMSVNVPNTTWTGNLALAGGISQTAGAGGGTATFSTPVTINSSLTQIGTNSFNGISVDQHVHTGDSGGTTSKPL